MVSLLLTLNIIQISHLFIISIADLIKAVFSKEVGHLQCSYTNHSLCKLIKVHPDFPVCGDCNVLFHTSSFVFNFFHVLGTERSGFKCQWFSNFLNFFWNFLGTWNRCTWWRPLAMNFHKAWSPFWNWFSDGIKCYLEWILW